jgi:serine/threonine protein kinase
VFVRRILPSSLIVGPSGRGTLTDLRYSSFTLPFIPPHELNTGLAFMAPEVRAGRPGDAASDVYTAAAILYYALTGQEPAAIRGGDSPRPCGRPRLVFDRPSRAMQPDPWSRYITAWEMYEDFARSGGRGEPGGLHRERSRTRWWNRPSTGKSGCAVRSATTTSSRPGGTGGSAGCPGARSPLERLVALKVLHPALIRDPSVVERFRREAQLAARLEHPNIVNIYEIGGRSGLIWYTMELIDGPSLAQQVAREGPLPLDKVLRLLREGLALAKPMPGTGASDIKPENMLLDSSGSLKITDFGLALALRGAGRFGGATSQSGTPQFASPEQLLGEKVDQRTDLYSLAAVAFYALLGRPPFTGRHVAEILAKQTADHLPDLLSARPDVGEPLARVLERAVRSDPDQRYASANEFYQAVTYAAAASNTDTVDTPFWSGMANRLLGRGPSTPGA